jgi:hypothetical protein
MDESMNELESKKKLSYNIERTDIIIDIPLRCKYIYKFQTSQLLENIDKVDWSSVKHDEYKEKVIDYLLMEFKHALNNVVFGDPAGKDYVNYMKEIKDNK